VAPRDGFDTKPWLISGLVSPTVHINGLKRFFPDAIKDDQQLPNVVFTDFLLSNQTVPIKIDKVENSEDSP
jgi:hypothetical protein